jgi:hypothetical protein
VNSTNEWHDQYTPENLDGQQLKLTIAGTYVRGSGLPLTTLNKGKHIVHTGAERASFIQLPMVPWTP